MRIRPRLHWPSVTRAMLAAAALAFSLSACGGGSTVAAATIPANSSAPPLVDTSAVTAADPGSQLPAGWHKGAFIEIYVRGYRDSDGDGIGDLRGLTQSLDYLLDLGVKGIWLMPVTRSQDHDHGYAVTDYRNIETAYGNLADFDELLKQAHARGIGVILDYVINHSAAQNPLFINAAAAAGNPYRSWYVWQNPAPAGWSIYGSNPWYGSVTGAYFAGFGNSMPDFNLLNPAVVAYHRDGLRFWLNRGVDGFRFDAVGHLIENGPNAWNDQPQNYTLMNDVRALVASYEHRYMVCEAPDDPTGFSAPTACGSAFAFGHQQDIVNAAKGNSGAIQAIADYFKTASPNAATMLSNHDSFAGQRLWDQVGGNLAQYRLAAATYLLQPGTPFIYYGEEIGMAGAAGLDGDARLRTPMSWTADSGNAGFSTGKPFRALSANAGTQNAATQLADPNSLLSFYKAMLALRNTLPALAQGSYEASFVSGSVLGYQRKAGSEQVLVLINYGTNAASVTVGGLAANASLIAAYPGGGAKSSAELAGSAHLAIDAQSVLVFAVQP